jgi:hypothetical protein
MVAHATHPEVHESLKFGGLWFQAIPSRQSSGDPIATEKTGMVIQAHLPTMAGKLK